MVKEVLEICVKVKYISLVINYKLRKGIQCRMFI